MRIPAWITATTLATMTVALGSAMGGAQADTIPTAHFRDLVAGQATLQYGEPVGVWSCWRDPTLNISLYAMDAGGRWQTVSTDNTLVKDPTNCDVAGLPYRAVNAWTVSIRGSQPSGLKRGVVLLGLGWKSVAPTSKFSLAPTGQVTGSTPKGLSWDALSAGKATLPLGTSTTVAYPGCGPNNLYALDNSGLLGAWQQVASRCDDAWSVMTPGSQGVGTQLGLTLLAAGPAKPQYTYGLATVTP